MLESAVSYALAGAALVTPPLLRCPTLCPGWDLETLLDHVSDSIGVLHEARQPVPPGLAAVLLPIAPLLITPGTRLVCSPTRFGCPAQPVLATSLSPSSAASRVPRRARTRRRPNPARGAGRSAAIPANPAGLYQ